MKFPATLDKFLGTFCSNQSTFDFFVGAGCQQAHRVLNNVLLAATKKGFELHLCNLDLSKVFDPTTHFQAISSPF